jgi:uncharacterized protein YegJ (DUF2314 family)
MREILSRSFGALIVLTGFAIVAYAAWSGYTSGRWRELLPAILGLVFITVGWPRLFPDTFAPLPVNQDDPLMKAGIEQARREMRRFLDGVHEGRKQAFVKFPMQTRSGVEHIWGIVHNIDRETALVSLANQPVDAPAEGRQDPRIRVEMSNVEDWMLVASDGTTEGGYSTKAMAQIYKREKGYLPAALKKQLAVFKDFRLQDI